MPSHVARGRDAFPFLCLSMHIFFSDAHLGFGSREDSRERERHILRFLEHVGTLNPESLWIVGDLFDYWFEYRTVIPKEFVRTIGAIAALADANIPVEYVIGNHDFGHKNFFESELGVKVHRDDVERELAGHRVLISHGDGKALNDMGYLILKKILRARTSNALWRWLHPDIGIGVAARASRRSRDHTTKKHYGGERPGEADGLQVFAQKKIEKEGFDLVIMGHNHRAAVVEFDGGTCVNLGNWMGKERTYLEVGEEKVELRKWRSIGEP